MNVQTKTAVTISEMARMCGLSRARFYQLIGTAFPHPVYDVSSRRPFFDEEAQKTCLEVRRRNCGIDGRPILFYAKRLPTVMPTRTRSPAPKNSPIVPEVLDGLRSLGMSVSSTQVDAAIKEVFPSGAADVEAGEIIRAVFIHIQRQKKT